MRGCCRRGILQLALWAAITAAVLTACTPATNTVPRRTPLVLSDPTSTASATLTLTVGTNRWNPSAAALEEAFFPLAVTMHNTSERPLCGGAPTAALQSPDGASSAAVFPTSVVTQLFGPVASVGQRFRQQTACLEGSNTGGMLLLVHGSHGGYGHGGGMPSGIGGGHRFAPLPFPSPYYSPFLSPFYSPFASPFYSPFAPPFSRYAPYVYDPTLPLLPPRPPSLSGVGF